MALFVTFEGVDGAGKSMQLVLLARQLRAAGHDVVTTREPGGAPGAEDIRKLLVEGEPGRWSPETEILLFTAARRDHVERIIRPALAAGKIVICDRYVDSTRAYQGSGERRDIVDDLHDRMIACDPDLTLIFDLDPATALTRAASRDDGAEDRFEQMGIAFQRQLRAAFRDIAAKAPERCRVIDADRAPDVIAAEVLGHVTLLLEQRDG